MKHLRSIMLFLSTAIVVMLVGGLAGWYVFVHKQISTTQASDAGRGSGASFGNPSGNLYENAGANSPVDASSSQVSAAAAPRLWRVSGNPVAGFGFASSSVQLFFVESSTGNIFRADPGTSKLDR